MRTLRYFFEDASNHKIIVHQLDFIGAFIQFNVKHRVFVKLDSRYGEYFPEYFNYFGRPLRFKKSMYDITNPGRLFSDELTNYMIDKAGFTQLECKMYIFYKYAPDVSKLVVLSYADECVYWYIYEKLGNWFVDTLRKKFYVHFLVYTHWFMYIRISQLKDHYISVDQSRYDTYVVAKYVEAATMK